MAKKKKKKVVKKTTCEDPNTPEQTSADTPEVNEEETSEEESADDEEPEEDEDEEGEPGMINRSTLLSSYLATADIFQTTIGKLTRRYRFLQTF